MYNWNSNKVEANTGTEEPAAKIENRAEKPSLWRKVFLSHFFSHTATKSQTTHKQAKQYATHTVHRATNVLQH